MCSNINIKKISHFYQMMLTLNETKLRKLERNKMMYKCVICHYKLRINYRFPLYHVYHQFSGAIAFGNVCPWLNGPSVLLHRNAVAINSTLKSITLTHCEYYSVHYVPLTIIQNSINNVTLIRMHKHNKVKCKLIFTLFNKNINFSF